MKILGAITLILFAMATGAAETPTLAKKPSVSATLSSVEPQVLTRCGSDPIIYLQTHRYTEDGIDIFTMKNMKGNVIGCAMYVTYRIEEWINNQYVYTGDGWICLDTPNTQNVLAVDTTRIARLKNISARWASC